MNPTSPRTAGLVLVACCVLAGCEERAPDADRAPAADIAAGDSVYLAPDARVSLPSSRIYYTLTSHEWYARGEPLVHDGRTYRPAGMPVSASVTEMTKLGEFRGVEYYGREGEPRSVYVPVFEGYWQSFGTDATLVDTAAAAPPPPDPDSSATRG